MFLIGHYSGWGGGKLTVRPTIEIQKPTPFSTPRAQDPPICSQHIDIHIDFLRRCSNMQVSEPGAVLPNGTEEDAGCLGSVERAGFADECVGLGARGEDCGVEAGGYELEFREEEGEVCDVRGGEGEGAAGEGEGEGWEGVCGGDEGQKDDE